MGRLVMPPREGRGARGELGGSRLPSRRLEDKDAAWAFIEYAPIATRKGQLSELRTAACAVASLIAGRPLRPGTQPYWRPAGVVDILATMARFRPIAARSSIRSPLDRDDQDGADLSETAVPVGEGSARRRGHQIASATGPSDRA